MTLAIYLLVALWIFVLAALALIDIRLRKIQAKANATWEFLSRRGDVVSVLDGWMNLVEDAPVKRNSEVPPLPLAPVVGFKAEPPLSGGGAAEVKVPCI